MEAALPPRAFGQGHGQRRGDLVQILADGLERDLRVERHLTQGVVQELRPLKPPVAEQLRVVDGREDCLRVVLRPQNVFHQRHEMGGVLPRPLLGPVRIVGAFRAHVRLVPADAPVAQTEGLFLLHDELLVELQVPLVARIAVFAAPDLMAGRRVAPEDGQFRLLQQPGRVHQVGSVGGVGAVLDLHRLFLELLVDFLQWPKFIGVHPQRFAAVQQAALDKEVFDAVFGQKLVRAFPQDGCVRGTSGTLTGGAQW